MLSLHCCVGFSLVAVGSTPQLLCAGLVAPQHMGFSQTRDWTGDPRIARQTPNHKTTREAPLPNFCLPSGLLFIAKFCENFFWSLAEWSPSSASSFEAVPQNGPPGATDQATFSPEHQSRSLSESRFEGLSAALSHTHSLPCPSPFVLSEGFSDHLVFSHFYNCRHLQFSITCFPLAVSFTLGKWLTKTVSSPGLNFHRIILKV